MGTGFGYRIASFPVLPYCNEQPRIMPKASTSSHSSKRERLFTPQCSDFQVETLKRAVKNARLRRGQADRHRPGSSTELSRTVSNIPVDGIT